MILPALLSLPTFCPENKFRDVFPLRHRILAAPAVSSLHNKHNFNGTNIITMDLAETKDWKDVVKEESVLNYKNGLDN
jgi:S-ribosylhomocysteine lyase LuxS involved in autoinducer biosynthesis